jgi:murein DD-endopeptidase MepM/ murein hydrolase activator NlpD
MKEQNGSEKKKEAVMKKEKKFYLFTAIGCAAVLIAIIIVAIAVTNASDVEQGGMRDPSTNESVQEPDDNETLDGSDKDDKPVVTVPEGMILPVASATTLHDYGFYHNQTLNSYYEHAGIDFTAAAGTAVMAVESGTIESIYKEDILLGTEIVVDHGDGLKTVYRFVTEAEGLKVGDEVKKGEVIATVAEASGNEYKDGAHLHFEIMQDGKTIDPALRLPLEEK